MPLSPYKKRIAFTLVEILIVMALMSMMFVIAVRGFVNSQQSLTFGNVSQQVIGMVREARSLAITGKAQLDYTNYDLDGFDAATLPPDGPDFVTPAHYGIYFDLTAKRILLFADIHTDKDAGIPIEGQFDIPSSAVGTYQSGKDLVLAEYQLPNAYDLIVQGNTSNIFYSPVLADTTFDSNFNEAILNFGIKETKAGGRLKCFSVHVVSGVPEEVAASECQ